MSKHVKRILVLGPALVAVLLTFAAAAQAATITVSATADTSGVQCTLRDAITAANTDAVSGSCGAGSGTDVLDLSGLNGTITLGSALPVIFTPMTIQGPGASALAVSGNDAVRVFEVTSFAGTAAFSGLTMSHGRCGFGCGIQNDGTTTLNDVVIDHNVAVVTGGTNTFPQGGGVRNTGTITMTLSTVSSNSSTGTGGTGQNGPTGAGIFNGNGGTVTLDRSTVSGNATTAVAGAGGTTNANGGAISNFGTLNIRSSALIGNTVSASASAANNDAAGGAISNANAGTVNVSIDRSTISGNTASASGTNAASAAGGLNVFGTTYKVTSSTITGNSAASGANAVLGAVATFKNTIVAKPLGAGANCVGSATSQGFNLTDGTGCGFNQTSDQLNADPALDPAGLSSNGGPTETIALLPASPAVDHGLSSAGELVDQRGSLRPYDFTSVTDAVGGDGTDIGAFEVEDTTAPDTTITSGPGEGTTVPNGAPTFAFSSDDPAATFQCRYDAGAFGACSDAATDTPAAGLADGSHAFEVRSIDAAGNVDATPASRSFVVDATAPETTLTKVPTAKIKTKKKSAKVSIAFSSEAGAAFQCRLDGGAFASCNSPRTYTLKKGTHVIEIRATDAAGNVDATPARVAVTVKRKKHHHKHR